MNNPIIECRGLNLHFGDVHALKDITLSIKRGEIIGIMGPNGSGKTTLLKTILGIIKPESGVLRIFDCDCDKLFCFHRSKIAYLPQKSKIDPTYPLSVYEATMMGRYSTIGLFKRPSSKDKEIVLDMLASVGMDEYSDFPIGRLSGGQQQRVFIARALAQNPEVLLLDEPTTGLDSPAQTKLINLVKSLHNKFGLTIIFVTHEINMFTNLVDKVVLLNKKIYGIGTPEEILTKENLSKIYGENIHISRTDDSHYVFLGDHHAS